MVVEAKLGVICRASPEAVEPKFRAKPSTPLVAELWLVSLIWTRSTVGATEVLTSRP